MGVASFPLVLGELLHEVQFEVGNGEEDQCHAGQGHVVLPQPPGAPVDALALQIVLSSTYSTDKYTHIDKLSPFTNQPAGSRKISRSCSVVACV